MCLLVAPAAWPPAGLLVAVKSFEISIHRPRDDPGTDNFQIGTSANSGTLQPLKGQDFQFIVSA
jgi:hypothetical protein